MTACRCHCRGCGGHFASLEAFDSHRDGPFDSRSCSYPDDAGLVERTGACKIVYPPQFGITVYSTERAERAREYFDSENGPQAAPAKRKRAVGAM